MRALCFIALAGTLACAAHAEADSRLETAVQDSGWATIVMSTEHVTSSLLSARNGTLHVLCDRREKLERLRERQIGEGNLSGRVLDAEEPVEDGCAVREGPFVMQVWSSILPLPWADIPGTPDLFCYEMLVVSIPNEEGVYYAYGEFSLRGSPENGEISYAGKALAAAMFCR